MKSSQMDWPASWSCCRAIHARACAEEVTRAKDSARLAARASGARLARLLGAAQRLEGCDRFRGLEKGLASVAGEPGVRLERAGIIAPNADHHTRVVAGAAKQEREHCRATQAAVAPDPLAAVQNPVDLKGEKRRRYALATGGHAGEPREGAIRGEELERARHGRARGHDLELRAQPHG